VQAYASIQMKSFEKYIVTNPLVLLKIISVDVRCETCDVVLGVCCNALLCVLDKSRVDHLIPGLH